VQEKMSRAALCAELLAQTVPGARAAAAAAVAAASLDWLRARSGCVHDHTHSPPSLD
jgi:hypothetical protein